MKLYIVDISGIDCIPYYELNLPINKLYSSIGVPPPHTLQKWISPDFIVDNEFDETDGDVYQYGT